MSLIVLSAVIFTISLGLSLGGARAAVALSSDNLQRLTSISSGLLLVSAILVVLPEGFHMVAAASSGSNSFAYRPLVLGAVVLAGFLFMLVLEALGLAHAVHEEHHDHLAGHGHGHVHHPKSGLVMSIGLSAHALGDGLAIGAAVASGEAAISVLVTFGVIVHRIPAALSLGIFSAHESDGKKSLNGNLLLFAAATPVALVVSYFVLNGLSEATVGLVLLFSAGTFIYITTVDTLPAVHNPETGPKSARAVVISAVVFSSFLLGMQGLGLLEHEHGHEHGHVEHDEHDEHEVNP